MLEFFTNFAEALAARAGQAVFWLYLFAFVAIFVIVVTLTNGFGIFFRTGVVRRHFLPPFIVERRKDNTRRGWSLYELRRLRQGSAALLLCGIVTFTAVGETRASYGIQMKPEPIASGTRFVDGSVLERIKIGNFSEYIECSHVLSDHWQHYFFPNDSAYRVPGHFRLGRSNIGIAFFRFFDLSRIFDEGKSCVTHITNGVSGCLPVVFEAYVNSRSPLIIKVIDADIIDMKISAQLFGSSSFHMAKGLVGDVPKAVRRFPKSIGKNNDEECEKSKQPVSQFGGPKFCVLFIVGIFITLLAVVMDSAKGVLIGGLALLALILIGFVM